LGVEHAAPFQLLEVRLLLPRGFLLEEHRAELLEHRIHLSWRVEPAAALRRGLSEDQELDLLGLVSASNGLAPEPFRVEVADLHRALRPRGRGRGGAPRRSRIRAIPRWWESGLPASIPAWYEAR